LAATSFLSVQPGTGVSPAPHARIRLDFSHVVNIMLELGDRDSGDQLNWTTAFLREEAVVEYIVGSSYELPELVLQYCVSFV